MVKPLNPLFPEFDMSKFDMSKFDMSKMMAAFDPAKATAEMKKMMEQFNLPAIDTEALLTAQRKNVDALTAANRLAYESMQAAMKRQVEILRASMEETTELMSRLGGGQTQPADLPEVIKTTFERALSNMRELSEIITKSNTEVLDVLNSRFSAIMDETKAMMQQVEAAVPAAPAAAAPAASTATPVVIKPKVAPKAPTAS